MCFSSLIKLLALTIALGAPYGALAASSYTPTTPPAEASPDATSCLTADVVTGTILGKYPKADIKETHLVDPPYYIVFVNPDEDTDAKASFDDKGCLTTFEFIKKGLPA